MTDEDIFWRVEDACLNGRPSPVEVHHDGWLIRASGGPVRRTNSLNPTRHRSSDLPAVLDAAEGIYAGLDRPTIVRVPSIASEMDDLLEERGYAVQAESRVLLADLSATERAAAYTVELSVGPLSEEWIMAWAEMAGTASPEALDAFRRSIAAIVLPRAFVAQRVDGKDRLARLWRSRSRTHRAGGGRDPSGTSWSRLCVSNGRHVDGLGTGGRGRCRLPCRSCRQRARLVPLPLARLPARTLRLPLPTQRYGSVMLANGL